MADDTPTGELIDWPTAEIHAGNLLRGFKGFEHARDILRTANEARHWLEVSRQEREALLDAVDKLKGEAQKARAAVTTAKRVQDAAEEAARAATAAAQTAEDQSAARVRAAERNQAARLAELDAELEGRRRKFESDAAARLGELDAQIGRKQATLSEVTAAVEALRNRL